MQKKKMLLIIIPICIVLIGAIVGTCLMLFTNKDDSKETNANLDKKYTISVKDENGNSLEDVYLVLCSENDKQISWLPYVTNKLGSTSFSNNSNSKFYAKVIGAPLGYEIDESIKYKFNDNGKLTIILKTGNIAYAAKIGETYYSSLQTALGVANSSNSDIEVEMLADSDIKPFTFSSLYGNTITVNGNGFVLKAEGANNTFTIAQDKGTVNFKNFTFKHKNTGSAFQITGEATVNLTDINLDATEGTAYNYALINTLLTEGTSNLNLTNVNAKMSVGTPAKADEAGIIRTGNPDSSKTVNITLNGCNFDTTKATGRSGIVIMKKTTANIKINDSIITAGDAYAIWNTETSISNTLKVKNSVFKSTISPYSATPLCGYEVKIDDVYYPTITQGINFAENSNQDITLTLIKDLTINSCTINGKNKNLITIDGDGKTLTTDKGNNAFVVGKRVRFKNMNINHKNTGSIVQIKEKGTIDINDVNVNATEGSTYTYTLFNILAPGDTSTLNMKNVNVKMAVKSKGQDNFASIIRTGNTTEADKNTVIINLNNCILDTSGATERSGIAVVPNTKATVNLKNTKIITKDTFAILSNEETINWNNSDTVLTSLSDQYKIYPVKGYLAKIGDIYYTFDKAIKLSNDANANTTINLLSDYSPKIQTINNKNGNKIIIKGNGKTLTTAGGNNAFTIGKNVAVENVKIIHKDTGSVFQITEPGKLELNKVDIVATEGKEYKYALINTLATGETTLNLDDVNIKMAVSGAGATNSSAIIRTGNDFDTKTVHINLNNCNLDTTAATGRSGIVVMQKTTANIKMNNSTISTLNEAPIKANENSSLAYTLVTNNCTLTSKTAEFEKEPIRGYDAKIGDVIYHDLKDAMSQVNNGETIELLQDFSIGEIYISKPIIIDGNDHTITATSSFSGGNTFIVNESTDFTIKNLKINDERSGSIVQVKKVSNVELENVDINATKSKNGYDYCLINLLATGNNASNLTLKSVNIKMSADGLGKDGFASVIRTGNFGSTEAKKVNIIIDNCNLDATDAKSRYGIAIMDTTNATVNISNTKIKTQNVSAVKCFCKESGTLTVDRTDGFICGKKVNEIDGYTYSSGNVYSVIQTEDILQNAINSIDDVTLNLSKDTTVDFETFKNKNGKKIEINTNGYSLSTTGTKDKTVGIINTDAQYISETESIYCTLTNAILYANAATTDVKIKLLQNITVNGVKEFKNPNGIEITFDGNGQTVITTKGSDGNNNAFKITSAYTGKNITFKNMTIEHRQTQALFQVQATGLTLNILEITVNTDKNIDYKYGLINLEKNSNLVLKKSIINLLAVSSNDKNSNAIIRTGNDSYPNVDNSKTVNITIDDSKLDASKASNRNGILIMNTTKSEININNSDIYVAPGAYVINRMVSDLTTEDIKKNTNVYVEGDSELKAGNTTSISTIINNVESSHIQAVRTVVLKVPNEFYEGFITALKKFAESVGWKLNI